MKKIRHYFKTSFLTRAFVINIAFRNYGTEYLTFSLKPYCKKNSINNYRFYN